MKNDSLERRKEQWLVSAVTIVLCLIIKFMSLGFGTIVFFPFIYLPVLIIHAKVLAAAFRSSETPKPGLVPLMYASNLFLLAAFLVQVDAGDGEPWMAIFKVLGLYRSPISLEGDWWGVFNLIAFIPVFITWGLTWGLMPTHHKNGRSENETE